MEKVRIIAEAGVNHNGDIRIARRMIEEAEKCGADIVKFQTFHVKSLVSGYAGMAEYQKKNLSMDGSQESMLNQLALSEEDFLSLAAYCKETGIKFLSTPFDMDSIAFLDPLQDLWKIPSGEITNYPYLLKIARTGKEIILSTGMCTMEEVDAALKLLKSNGAGKITLLHCTTSYPAPMKEVNLNAMLTMKEHCGCPVGYSDHTLGIEVPIAATAMGAVVIEKHFTLDKNMRGPDHRASLVPEELERMIKSVRNIERAMGNGVKVPSEVEKANMTAVRKSIVAARDIRAGEWLTEENLAVKRPGDGISPMRWKEVIGTKAARDYSAEERIVL